MQCYIMHFSFVVYCLMAAELSELCFLRALSPMTDTAILWWSSVVPPRRHSLELQRGYRTFRAPALWRRTHSCTWGYTSLDRETPSLEGSPEALFPPTSVSDTSAWQCVLIKKSKIKWFYHGSVKYISGKCLSWNMSACSTLVLVGD